MTIDPATRGRTHLERRRQVEQVPRAIELDEQPLAVRAEQPAIAVRGRKETIEAHVPLREHRMKHAFHPGGRGQRSFIRRDVQAGAQHVTVRPQYAQLLGAQHDVRVFATKEREQRALLVALLVTTLAREQLLDSRRIEIDRLQRGCNREQGCGRCDVGRHEADRALDRFGQRSRFIDALEIRRRGRARMIRAIVAEESRADALAGIHVQGRVLNRDQRMLVLQTAARQRLAQIAQLQRVRCKRRCTAQRSDHTPGITPFHRKILPRSDRAAARRMLQRGVVDVLTDVVLVQTHGCVRRKRNVLRVDEIQLMLRRRGVEEPHVPEPRRCVLREHERNHIVDALPRPGADQAAVRLPQVEARRAARPEERSELGSAAMMAPQIEIRRAAFELVTDEQVQRGAAAVEAADRATRGHFDAQSRAARQSRSSFNRSLNHGAKHTCQPMGAAASAPAKSAY